MTTKIAITNNIMENIGAQAINVTAGGGSDHASLWANVTGNTIRNPDNPGTDQAIHFNKRSDVGRYPCSRAYRRTVARE